MTDNETEDPMRAFARALWADPDEPGEPDPDEQQKPSGHVPGEGTNPTGEAHDVRAWVEALFYNHDD